jgi:deoxyribose-phosphate aldolase
MNNRDELINRVTKEVLKLYPVQESSPLPQAQVVISESPKDSARLKALILCCGNSILITETVDHFKAIKRNYRQAKVLLSENASKLFEAEKSKPFAGYEYLLGEKGVEDLHSFDHFYLINPTLNTLSKMAALQGDTLPALISRKALLWNKPVFILLDQSPRLPQAMQTEFDLIIEKLVNFGYQWQGQKGQALPQSPTPASIPIPGPVPLTPVNSVTPLPPQEPVPSASNLAKMIDHTLLMPETSKEEIENHCAEASRFEFFSVCVQPSWVEFCSELLKNSPVKICTVIGFPLGANSSQVKAFETAEAVKNGADEIDMVLNIGALKSSDYDGVKKDIQAVLEACSGRPLKVILETALLSREEIIIACRISKDAGVQFVKTSTGFSKGGATIEHIRLMRHVVGPSLGVKASGGVRDSKFAKELIEAGATRLGASSSIAIVTGKNAGEGNY